MKKIYFNIAVCLFILLFCSLTSFNKSTTSKKLHAEDEHIKITAAMMNGKPAFFKTYEDFVNGTGKPWLYLDSWIAFSKNKITGFDIVFRNESGKKVTVSSTDFWGWRDPNGEVERNGDFVHQGMTKLPFRIEYIANDFVLYGPTGLKSGFEVTPNDWCSEGIHGSIVSMDDYFKNHSNATYEKIMKAYKECTTQIPDKKYYGTAKNYYAQELEIARCRAKAPELICIWTDYPGKNISTNCSGGYVFNENSPHDSK